MTIFARSLMKYVLIVVVLAVFLLVWGVVFARWLYAKTLRRRRQAAAGAADAVAQLAPGKDAISLPPELAANLGIQTCKVE